MSKKEKKVRIKKKRNKTVKIVIWVVAAAVVTAGAIVFIPRIISNDEDSSATLQKRTSIVAQGDVVQTLGSSAPVESANTDNIKAGQTGEVLEIMVEDSDIVSTGTIIMTLDTSSTDSSIEALEGQIEAKQEQIDDKNDSIESKYSQIEDKEEDIASKYEDIADYRDNLQDLDDEVDENEQLLSELEIKAPASGSIFNLSVSEGETINTTKVIATITDTNSYSVEMTFDADILEREIQSIEISQLSNDFIGQVESISGYTYKDEFSNEKVDIIISFDTETALKDRATVTAKIVAGGFTYYCNKETTPYYDTIVNITSEVSGEVLEMNITEKQYVTEGEILAVVDSSYIDDKADSLLSQIENMQAQIDTLYDSIESASEDIEQYYDDITDFNEDILSLEEDIADIEDEIDEKKEEYEAAVIIADFDGIVSGIRVAEGDSVSANTVLFSLISLESPSIIVSIDELDIANVKKGMEAEVTIDALEFTEKTPVEAVVTKISPEGNYQGGVTTFDVTVTLTESVEGLMLNMNATATIYVGKSENTLYIPIEAVTIQGEKSYVYVQDSTATGVPVVVGSKTDGSIAETSDKKAAVAGGQRQGGVDPANMTDEQKAQMEAKLAERGMSLEDVQSSQNEVSESVSDIAEYYSGTIMVEVTTGINNEMYIEILDGLSVGDVVVLPPLYTSSTTTETATTSAIKMPGIGSFGGTGTGGDKRPTGGN